MLCRRFLTRSTRNIFYYAPLMRPHSCWDRLLRNASFVTTKGGISYIGAIHQAGCPVPRFRHRRASPTCRTPRCWGESLRRCRSGRGLRSWMPSRFPPSDSATRPERDPAGLVLAVVPLCARCRFHAYFASSIISAGAGRARGTVAAKILRQSVIFQTLLLDVAATFYGDSHGEPVRLIVRAKKR